MRCERHEDKFLNLRASIYGSIRPFRTFDVCIGSQDRVSILISGIHLMCPIGGLGVQSFSRNVDQVANDVSHLLRQRDSD
jgi:hypothetical protein